MVICRLRLYGQGRIFDLTSCAVGVGNYASAMKLCGPSITTVVAFGMEDMRYYFILSHVIFLLYGRLVVFSVPFVNLVEWEIKVLTPQGVDRPFDKRK